MNTSLKSISIFSSSLFSPLKNPSINPRLKQSLRWLYQLNCGFISECKYLFSVFVSVKEVENLDWNARMRIVMGSAYCLQYMHDLNPPVAHSNLVSRAIFVTDDNAAKVCFFLCPILYSCDFCLKPFCTRIHATYLLTASLLCFLRLWRLISGRSLL